MVWKTQNLVEFIEGVIMSTYKAFVSKIDKVLPIQGADKIQIGIVMGEQVVISKNWGEGKVGLFFPADTQLSTEFCHHNNLFRNSELNANKNAKGFFDENRRVRCQPFMKVKSEGFFCEISSLYFTNDNKTLFQLKVGDVFDEINGFKICQKYVNPRTKNKAQRNQQSKKKEVVAPLFKQHMDTAQFKYYVDKIQEGDLLSFHAKAHGTSFRCSHTLVKRKRTDWYAKLYEILFRKELYTEGHEYVAGSRRVDLFEEKKESEGFHGSNQFRYDVLDMFKPYLEPGMTVYGEICGYVNGSPIMGTHSTEGLKDKAFKKKYGDTITYTYNCKEHQFRVHVYRVTYTTSHGTEVDLTNDQVLKWCEYRGFNPPYEIHPSMIYNGDKESLVSLVESLTEREEVLTEDYIDPSHISEGVIVRVDNGNHTPTFYKSKSYPFRVLEGIVKESGEEDLEEVS